MTGRYCFAQCTIDITTLCPETHALCAAYRAEGMPVFSVETSEADIEFERIKSAREAALEGHPPYPHSDGYWETLAVYRKIAERMPAYDTVLFHGSCVAVDGAGYLFSAKSGTGKSTHARLWRELLGGRAVMVNDDKPLIRIDSNGATAFGTPWDGKHNLSSNMAVPLRALCILERSSENRIEPISAKEAFPVLLQQTYRPADTEMLAKTLQLVDRLAASVRLYRLGCNMELDAARLAYDAMRG
ncbi:MAG: hypothetical protein IIY43_06050 [Oscillospiraceae bacterium]|nr:hypothetical protein [Lachnospiraceae bacterium]MBQ1362596.1 hypothetical protein [Oscillospiraceae bacterium]